MVVAAQQANMYTLKGGTVEVIYSASSITSKRLLTYQDSATGEHYSFRGRQIRLARQRDLGPLVSVTLRVVDDLETVTATLLVPPVELPDGKPVEIATLLVRTTHRTSIIGAPDGPGLTYHAIALKGKAAFVVS